MGALTHRLFYGLSPAKPLQAEIAQHRDSLGRGVLSQVSDGRLHLTMGITPCFDAFPARLAEHMIAAAERVKAEPFDFLLDRLSAAAAPRHERGSVALRPARRPPQLSALSRRLCEPLRRADLLRERWTFNPHVTLAYWRGDSFQQPIAPILWHATDFVLIHSIVGATRHIELGRWPLVQRQHAFAF